VNRTILRAAIIGVCVAMLPCASAVSDEDDAADKAESKSIVSVSRDQQQAIGIVVARPAVIRAPERIEALGLVLDPESLINDVGELDAAHAAERASHGELERLRSLYRGGGDVSLKMLEAAQADQAKNRSQWQLAAARLSLRWSPVAVLPVAERERMLAGLIHGNGLLVRADIPGRQVMGALPHRALLAVDGAELPGRVLGVLRETNEFQGVGLLIAVDHPPLGLSAGARLPVTLLAGRRSGRLVRRDAIFYDDRGAYIYTRLPERTGTEVKFRAARVALLLAYDDGWLVDGINEDQDVVVHGAAALWSLQEMRGAADDGDDD